MTASASLRILLVDDHKALRSLLRGFLESHPTMTVAGEAGDPVEAVQQAEELRPDVVVVDMHLPTAAGRYDVNAGIEAVRDIAARCPDSGILVTTGLEQGVEKLSVALAAGARGFVTKYAEPDVMLAAIEGVARGELWVIVPREFADDMRRAIGRTSPSADVLTRREREILDCFCKGLADGQIARRFGIAPHTVANYFTSIQAKLGASDRVALLRKAQERGWCD